MNYLPLVNRKYRNGPTRRQDGRTRYRTKHSKHSIIKQNEEAFHFDTKFQVLHFFFHTYEQLRRSAANKKLFKLFFLHPNYITTHLKPNLILVVCFFFRYRLSNGQPIFNNENL